MSTVSVPRQPFGVLDSPRLAHLSSGKNRQNGVVHTPSPLSGKTNMAASPSLKRRLTPSIYDDYQNEDAENVKPDMFLSPTKRSKTEPYIKSKASSFASPSSFNFTFSTTKSAASSMPPPSAVPARLHTPMRSSPIKKLSPRTPLTAPAGRSPKQKRIYRRASAHTPFTRVDPPASSPSLDRTALPFSLDAALNSTLAPSIATTLSSSSTSSVQSKPATIEETMPQSWFFSIYEDTPDEEAENLMEHSTLTLDLGSDDETSSKDTDDRGKENVAPADYTTSLSNTSPTSRRSIQKPKSAADMDTDAASRSPLGHLDTEDFVPEGLTKDSIVIVLDSPDKGSSDSLVLPETKTSTPVTVAQDMAGTDVVSQKGETEGEILIWEDDTCSTPSSAGGKRKRQLCNEDE